MCERERVCVWCVCVRACVPMCVRACAGAQVCGCVSPLSYYYLPVPPHPGMQAGAHRAKSQQPAASPGAGSVPAAGSRSWSARRAALSDQPCNPPDKLLNTSPLLLSSQCQWPGLQSEPRDSIILSYLLTVSPAVSTNL